jgi:hypothetical protein
MKTSRDVFGIRRRRYERIAAQADRAAQKNLQQASGNLAQVGDSTGDAAAAVGRSGRQSLKSTLALAEGVGHFGEGLDRTWLVGGLAAGKGAVWAGAQVTDGFRDVKARSSRALELAGRALRNDPVPALQPIRIEGEHPWLDAMTAKVDAQKQLRAEAFADAKGDFQRSKWLGKASRNSLLRAAEESLEAATNLVAAVGNSADAGLQSLVEVNAQVAAAAVAAERAAVAGAAELALLAAQVSAKTASTQAGQGELSVEVIRYDAKAKLAEITEKNPGLAKYIEEAGGAKL